MDGSAQNHAANAHPQSSNNGTSYNNYMNGIQSFADLNGGQDNADFDAFAGWDSNLFTSNGDQPSTFLPQTSIAPTNYGQNVSRQSKSPALPQYGSQQQSFAANAYSQSSFEQRALSQTAYDPRFLQRPSPSPGPYSTYTVPQAMNYGRNDQTLHSPQPFAMHAQSLQPRPPSTTNPPYPSQHYQNPYFNQYSMQNMPMQNNEILYMNDYSNMFQQPSNRTINPSELTATNMSGVAKARQEDPSKPAQQRSQLNASPYFTAPLQADPRMQQAVQPQPGQQAIFSSMGPQTGVMAQLKPLKPSKPKTPKDPNAPKRPRGRPRKDGTIPRTKNDGQDSASSSEYDSDDDPAINDEPPDPKPALLVVSPPTDTAGKAMYDAVSAVWAPRNKPPVWENVTKGMALFAEAIKVLRDAWRVRNEAFKKADAANSPQALEMKKEVARFRQAMETTMHRSLQYGHDAHLSRLGENAHTLTALNSFLLDRYNAADYDGSLTLSILRILVKFTTPDKDLLFKTKIEKVLGKLITKGGKECKELSQKVLDNAAAVTKRKAESPQSPASPRASSDLSSKAPNSMPRKEPLVGSKRPRESEPNLPSTKRIITKPIPQASKPLAVQAAERRRAAEAAQAQAAKSEKSEKPTTNGSAAPPTVVKTKQPISVPKPQNSIFASLQSASKKPGTSNADRAAAAKDKPASVPKKKETSPPAASAPAKPAFSFMEALADMNKPKEVEQKKVEDLPPETDEERAKRLRKEERRKLRVSWKPDDSLVETKIFTHDPNEEVGHADSMMRDVDDIGGEGRMLKLHMDKKGLEDDEEDGEELEDYSLPSEVDFSEIPVEERDRNFIKAGGNCRPESASSEAQNLHEMNTLMVVYALPSDVPSTPKEPPKSADEDEYQPIAEFGVPTETTKKREARVIAARPQVQGSSATPAVDIGAILLRYQAQQTLQQQPQQPQQSTNLTELQRAIAMLGQSQQQQQQQQQQPPQPAAALDLNAMIANARIQAQAQAQQQQPAQPYPAQQPPNPLATNLAALMAQLQQTPQQPQSLPLGLSGNPNPFPGSDADPSRKHSRNDSSNENDGDYGRSKNASKKKKAGGSGSGSGSGSADGTKPYNYKTQICSFWQKGQCMKGDNCTYRHDNEG